MNLKCIHNCDAVNEILPVNINYIVNSVGGPKKTDRVHLSSIMVMGEFAENHYV